MNTPAEGTTAATRTPLKRAFLALEAAQARIQELETAANEPIAIIGLGCRAPGGVRDGESFWELLESETDAISHAPRDRWDMDALFDANPEAPGRIATREGGFLDSIDQFDPALFGIAPREAQGMDPQQRLLLEVAWESLEHAGIATDSLERSRTGVFVGACASDYTYMQLMTGDRALLDAHFTSGIAHSVLSGRLSYVFGLQGPSLTVDTACSSSLVAVHLACNALRARECDMALAGGVNLILSPDLYIALSHSRMLAPDGRCKTFDAAADGFARGEGCGVVVLKRLGDAEANGDRILAVIRGSAVNQDGPSSGLTAPNGPAQEAVIRQALARARVLPHQVGFVEAHGTGTQLGDPLEVRALGAAYSPGRDANNPLVIGSVKTNIGHLEAAAGVVALIKLTLSLQKRTIPAHLHFREPSPQINWAEFPLRVAQRAEPWRDIDGRRIGGVSSFGFSGTNAHLILEEAPVTERVPVQSGNACLFTLAARDEAALRELAARHARAIFAMPDSALASVCRTVNTGRAKFSHRAAIVARTIAELHAALAAVAIGESAEGLRTHQLQRRDPPRIAFLFTGQGSQYAGMARSLYDASRVFRNALDRCAALLESELDQPLLQVLFATDDDTSRLNETVFTQPALFAVEYALAQLWRSWGIVPQAVMGHSVGEIVAACVAGVMSLEDGVQMVAARGRAMQALPTGGAMAAIGASEDVVAEALRGYHATVAIAAVNGPAQTVISGVDADVQLLVALFKSRGVRATMLTVSHAFHSPLVDPMLDSFECDVATVKLGSARIKLVSNVTGRVSDGVEVTNASYWRGHVRNTVRFSDGLRAMMELKPDVLLEIGPHPVLVAFASATLGDESPTRVASLHERNDDWTQMLQGVASLYLEGAVIDWDGVHDGQPREVADLPTYPFQRERHWFRAQPQRVADAHGIATGHPLLGARLRLSGSSVIFEASVSAQSPEFVQDHVVLGRVVLPATAYLDMLTVAGRAVLRSDDVSASDVVVQEALVFEADAYRTLQTVVTPSGDGGWQASIASASAEDASGTWTTHVSAHLSAARPPDVSSRADLAEIRARCNGNIVPAAFYESFEARGLTFGDGFRTIRSLARGDGEALGEVSLSPAVAVSADAYPMHPVLLDGCLQVLAAALPTNDNDVLYLPIAFDGFEVLGRSGARCWSHVTVAAATGDIRRADVQVFDDTGLLLARLRGVQLKRVTQEMFNRIGERWLDACLYEMKWTVDDIARDGAAATGAPGEIAQHVESCIPTLLESAGIRSYDAFLSQLERLCGLYTAQAMQRLEWNPALGDVVVERDLAAKLGVASQHRRLFGRLLAILAEDGWLSREALDDTQGNPKWRVLLSWHVPDVTKEVEALRAICPPGAEAELEMTVRVASSLAEALRGEREPMQLLFPGGSLDTAERMYRDSPTAKFYNALMASSLARVIADAATDGRTLRILEVGAGTGGTTAHVLPLLPPSGVEYTFTDVGPLFVARAKDRFAANGFMRFETLDLERDLASQGFADRTFDIVIASNVIHATADLRRTVERVRGVLAPGGLLCMLEVTSPQRWFDLTVGLTSGWWAFTDTALRPDYATISARSWETLLSGLGFGDVVSLPTPETIAATGNAPHGVLSKQSVFLARATSSADDRPASMHRWIVFGDESGLCERVASRLRARSDKCVSVARGEYAFSPQGATANSGSAAELQRLFTDAAFEMGGVDGVVWGWSLDAAARGTSEVASDVLRVAQVLTSITPSPRLFVVTRGAQSVDGNEVMLSPERAAVWGFARTLSIEHPELLTVCIDFDAPSEQDADRLLAELDNETPEPSVAWRDTRRVQRLERVQRHVAGRAGQPSNNLTPWRLVPTTSGSLESFRQEAEPRRTPRDGEVEIAVESTGLNFKDVLNALGMYPGNPGPLGGECAGRVTAVGTGVTHVRNGDAVMAVAGGSFASHVVAKAELVQPLPTGVTFDEGASFSIPFLTADVCLRHFAKLQAGERVLIHAAAGGVGMAAVQLAQAVGAEIFATAGSESKRELLASMGVAHVLDSRDVSFAARVHELTNGEGVHVVLNSLSGEFVDASFSVLARGGRFVEIGKRGIKDSSWVDAQHRDWKYFLVDWGELAEEQPALIGNLYARLVDELRHGHLRALPRHVFDIDDASRAFRFMAQALHTGKIVVRHRHQASVSVRRDGTYLISGGLSGLGLLTAQWLSAQGAGRVVLIGRRGVTETAAQALETMRASGTEVVAESLDVSDEYAMRALLQRVRRTGSPIRGVVHSAGVLDNAGIMQQNGARFESVIGPKLRGATVLDVLTRGDALDWFVLYSSIASVLGAPGQSNHAAANAAIDTLAHARAQRGLPALSINWGAWGEIGAAADRAITDKLEAQGIGALAPAQGLVALQRAMERNIVQVTVLPVDWEKYLRHRGLASPPPFLRDVVMTATHSTDRASAPTRSATRVNVRETLESAPESRRRPLLTAFVRQHVLKALGLDPSRALDPRIPLGDLGLDSLLSVELRNTLGNALSQQLSATLLFDYPTLDALTDVLMATLGYATESVTVAPELKMAPAPSALVGAIEDMSDDEVDRLLAQRASKGMAAR